MHDVHETLETMPVANAATAARAPMPSARASVAAGLRAAWHQRRLVLLVWLVFLALAAFATLPTWHAWRTALSHAPEGDRLLDGLNLALMRELNYSDNAASPLTWPFMMVASIGIALLWNPFVSGGVLTVLLEDAADPRATVRERFLSGGARHYWRLARLLALTLALGGVLLVIAGGVLFAIAAAADDRGWEQTTLALTAGMAATVGALAGIVSLLLDYARIAIVRDGLRAWRALGVAMRLLARHPLRVTGFGLTFAILFAVSVVLYFTVSSALAFTGWGMILLGILLQQAFALWRSGLRVAMVAGELHMAPPPAPRPAPVPPRGADSDLPDLPTLA